MDKFQNNHNKESNIPNEIKVIMKTVELHKIFLISGIPIWKSIHKSGYIFLNFEVIYIYHSTLLFSLKNIFYDAVSWGK